MQPAPAPPTAAPSRPWVRLVLALFGAALLFATKSEPVSWADASRLGTIQGIVEHGTLALDDTAYYWQGDKVRIDGHDYSHQPPMLALVGAVPYGLLHLAGRAIDDPGTYRVLTWVLTGLPALLGLAALGRLARRAGASEATAALLVATAGFGTLLLPYALVLNQHGTAAGLVLLALEALVTRRDGRAGVLLALAATIDLTAAFFAVAGALALLLRDGLAGLRPLGRYAVAALPVLTLHFSVNHAIVGDLLPLGLHTEGFDYPLSPFSLMRLTGAGGEEAAGTGAAYAFGALFGASGLFSHHPVLLWALALGVPAVLLGRRGGAPPLDPATARALRAAGAAALLGAVGITAYYLVASRNFGGSSFGMRWFTVFAPALLLPAALAPAAAGPRARALLAPLLLWSVLAAGLGAVQPWAKFHYRWEDSPEGLAALPGTPVPGRVEHWRTEWRRVSNLREVFTRERYDQLFTRLLDQHRRLYLKPWPGMTPEQRRAWIEQGLLELRHVADLLDEDQSSAGSRTVAHFWLGEFHRALGERAAARREYEITLALSPQYDWARQKLAELGAPAPEE